MGGVTFKKSDMEFSLDSFVTNPSWDTIEVCKKADLLIVANFYDVQVAYSAKKAEIKRVLCDKLVEKGVLRQLSAAVRRPRRQWRR